MHAALKSGGDATHRLRMGYVAAKSKLAVAAVTNLHRCCSQWKTELIAE